MNANCIMDVTCTIGHVSALFFKMPFRIKKNQLGLDVSNI
jgi:hypothetical protein